MIAYALQSVLVCTQHGHHITCKPTVTAYLAVVCALIALFILILSRKAK